MGAGWAAGPADQPLPPQNVEVISPYLRGVLDIRWDNPVLLAGNTGFTVVGVNIWRSDVSDRGPFFRLNDFPLGGTFYRDQSSGSFTSTERVDWDTGWINRGGCAPNQRPWKFQTRFRWRFRKKPKLRMKLALRLTWRMQFRSPTLRKTSE